MNLNTKLILLIIFFQITVVKAQSQIENYLNTPSSLKIDNKDYNLVWSSNPDKNYFKQEYLTSEQKLEKYNKMVLIEFVKGDFKLENIVQQKINELENMKKSNPIVNHKVYENNGEYILDFLLSENSKDGKTIKIVERNVYRYKLISSNNTNGILLFAISERAYDNDIDNFFKNFKDNYISLIETVGNYSIPNISIK